jgi:hypothetical protein
MGGPSGLISGYNYTTEVESIRLTPVNGTVTCTGALFIGSTIGGAVQVVGPQVTGFTAGTGTANKGAFATYAGQTQPSTYSQADIQTLDNAVVAASQRILALEQALASHGLINA